MVISSRSRPWANHHLTAWLLVVLLIFSAMITSPEPVWALGERPGADPPASALVQSPASSDQLALYARIASVNTCIATGVGQDFEQAASVAGETIAQLILGVHRGLIQSSGSTPLSLDELRKGSINSAVIGATEICPNEVPAPLRDKVRQALAHQADASGT